MSFAAIAASSVDAGDVEPDADDSLKLCDAELAIDELTEVGFEPDELPPHPTATNSPNVHTVSARRVVAAVASLTCAILISQLDCNASLAPDCGPTEHEGFLVAAGDRAGRRR